MATNPTQNYEVPPEMRDFAEKSVEQARKAIDGFMTAAQKTADTFEGSANTVQASAKDAARKTFAYTEQNLSAGDNVANVYYRSASSWKTTIGADTVTLYDDSADGTPGLADPFGKGFYLPTLGAHDVKVSIGLRQGSP